jgi:hypothetical protein
VVVSVSLYARRWRICAAVSFPPMMAWNEGSSAMRCSSRGRLHNTIGYIYTGSGHKLSVWYHADLAPLGHDTSRTDHLKRYGVRISI